MSSLVKRSNGVYYQVTSVGNRRIWRSTGVRTRAEAQRIIRTGLEKARDRFPQIYLIKTCPRFVGRNSYKEPGIAKNELNLVDCP